MGRGCKVIMDSAIACSTLDLENREMMSFQRIGRA